MFSVKYPVRLNDISIDGKMRTWVLFDCLQDAAAHHADELGLGLKQLRQSDLSWVLSRIRLRMDEFPEYGDTLNITTYPSGFDRLFAYRQFILRSETTGKTLGVAGSAWLTLKTSNFRPVSPVQYLQGLPQWEKSGDIFFQAQSLAKIFAPDTPCSDPLMHRVSSAMIDYNQHLNNAFYAMFTEDWLGAKLNSVVRMSDIQINFNSSMPFTANLECTGFIGSNGQFYVTGSCQENSKNAFQAQGICNRIPERSN